MPRAVAARPRDERGYPVLAITPWEDGQPRFAATDTARTYICAVERRCSVCGLGMEPGPVWRVVSGPEADAIDAARAAGLVFVNRQATVEAPGHRLCMLYAAVICPYLSRPTARRGAPAQLPGAAADRGDQRGLGGAVASFDEVEFRLTDVVLFRFQGLGEFRRHQLGEEQLDELVASLGDDTEPGEVAPVYLADNEEAATERFQFHRTD
jgi:hypothetical protein